MTASSIPIGSTGESLQTWKNNDVHTEAVTLTDSSGVERDASNPLPVAASLCFVDEGNSTSTPLGSNGTFTGTGIDASEYQAVMLEVFSNKASATNGLQFQTSTDGTNWDHYHSYTVPANSGIHFEESIPGKYFRIVYTNTNSAQSVFRLQTKLLKTAATAHVHPLNHDIDEDHPAAVTRAVLTGETSAGGGGFVNVKVNPSGTLEVNANQSTSPWVTSVQSETLVKGTVTASSSGDTTVYTPASGMKIRLYFFGYSAGSNVTGNLVGLKLAGYNSGAVFDNQYLSAAGQPYARNIQGGKRYIEGSADGALTVNLSASQTVYVNYELEEV